MGPLAEEDEIAYQRTINSEAMKAGITGVLMVLAAVSLLVGSRPMWDRLDVWHKAYWVSRSVGQIVICALVILHSARDDKLRDRVVKLNDDKRAGRLAEDEYRLESRPGQDEAQREIGREEVRNETV